MRRWALIGGIATVVAASSIPFLWSVLTSVKSTAEVFRTPPTWFPETFSLESYAAVFERRPFARYLLNSVLVAVGSTALALAAGALAAYALTRLRVRRAAFIQGSLLAFALFPPAVLLVPLFRAAGAVGLVNSYAGVILVHAALNVPFAVWALAAFFREIPLEIEEAARVDGFSRLQVLGRIVVPLSAPALAATAILLFIFSWNEFVVALTFLQRDAMRTVPVGISMLSGVTVYEVPWDQISAAIVMTTLPVVVAVLAFQRWILSGLTAGAVKG
jgi:multiple sugar transport system permease protein